MTSDEAAKLATKAADVSKMAFASGDNVTGIAAIVLAAQLLQLARILGTVL